MFEMAAPIQNPAKYEVLSVIGFLNAKGERSAEIHKQIVDVFGNIMNGQNVKKWCREFSEGRTDVHDDQRSGRPYLISDELLQDVEGENRANRSVTIRELNHIISEVSKTTIHEALTEKLGYRKLCARWVPRILKDDHKTKRMGSSWIYWTIRRTVWTSRPAISTCSFTKKHLAGENFDDDDEVQEEIMTWFREQAADSYDSGLQKLVPRLKKSLDNAGDYVEK